MDRFGLLNIWQGMGVRKLMMQGNGVKNVGKVW